MVNNWMITGGCGFLGTSLIKKILKESPNANIRILDNLTVGTEEDLSEVSRYKKINVSDIKGSPIGVELAVGDIRDYQSCLKASIGVECVVHFAANTGVGPSVEDPRLDMEANIIGVFNALEASRQNNVDKFIFASSGAPVGEVLNPPIHEEMPSHPVSPYGASKLAGEGYCSAYYLSYGLKTISLRFGNVYGPRSKYKSSIVAKFIKQACSGEVCEIYGDGSQTRDFIYIDDLINAVIKSSEANVGGEVFQIAAGKETTINEVCEIISEKLLDKNIDMKINKTETRIGDVLRNFSDTSKANKVLRWSNQENLDSGIEKTVDYFINF